MSWSYDHYRAVSKLDDLGFSIPENHNWIGRVHDTGLSAEFFQFVTANENLLSCVDLNRHLVYVFGCSNPTKFHQEVFYVGETTTLMRIFLHTLREEDAKRIQSVYNTPCPMWYWRGSYKLKYLMNGSEVKERSLARSILRDVDPNITRVYGGGITLTNYIKYLFHNQKVIPDDWDWGGVKKNYPKVIAHDSRYQQHKQFDHIDLW